jgi:ferrous iron transport protein A
MDVNKVNKYYSRFHKDRWTAVKSKTACIDHDISAAEPAFINPKFIQLISLKEGDEGEVVVIRAGRAATQRLNEMGLVPETKIKILRKGVLKGPVEILVRNSRLAIGAGLAAKIYVKIIN